MPISYNRHMRKLRSRMDTIMKNGPGRLASRKGTSIVEVVIAITLMSILSIVVAAILGAIATTTMTTAGRVDQLTQGDRATGYFASIVGKVPGTSIAALTSGSTGFTAGGVSYAATPAGIKPAAIAGDQMIVATSGTCFRLMYLKAKQELWSATSDSCASLGGTGFTSSQGALRGPNQDIGTFQPPVSSRLWDPVLDRFEQIKQGAVTDIDLRLLASGVVPVEETPIFTFRFVDQQLADTDQHAVYGAATPKPFYQSPNPFMLEPSNLVNLNMVEMSFRVLASASLPESKQPITPRSYSQSVFLGQLCAS